MELLSLVASSNYNLLEDSSCIAFVFLSGIFFLSYPKYTLS